MNVSWNFKDLTGNRYERLTVISRAENDNRGGSRWHCLCDCGGKTTTNGANLIKGHTLSCGCLRYERLRAAKMKHGMSRSSTFRIWWGIMERCTDPNHKSYKNYGGRGIGICNRWMEFKNFFNDMGHPPKGFTIERIDNNGDYTPKNCKWASMTVNLRNKRNNHVVEINGTRKCIAEWSEEYDANPIKVRQRLVEYGWSPIRALTEP